MLILSFKNYSQYFCFCYIIKQMQAWWADETTFKNIIKTLILQHFDL